MTNTELKAALFAKGGQYTEDKSLVAAITALSLPELGSGLTGGRFGTSQQYADHKWGGNVVRICGVGFEQQKASAEVLDVSASEYAECQKA